MKDVLILAIESSCDETSVGVIKNGEILSNIIATQIDIHTLYGGVVPEIASRNHLMKISEVTQEALNKAGVDFSMLDAIAVTKGPGLIGALLIGVSYAKALAFALKLPIIGVNHLAGHISANYVIGTKPPFICLVVSGGNTMIVKVSGYTDFEVLGATKDDAVGEAFDKVARVLGLGYPGGPKLDREAEKGDPTAIDFPRVMMKDDNYDFSFSGLKSSVLNYINKKNMKNEEIIIEDVCASFRQCVCDILVNKTIKASKEHNINQIAICGGVSCNEQLRKELKTACDKEGISLSIPPKELCSDNAAMIASMAYRMYLNGDFEDIYMNATSSMKL